MGGRDHTTLVEIWNNIPSSLEENVIMCDNYRAVTLLCRKYKILANILYVKLVPDAEEITGEYQGGFQRGGSTV
jgi:hypothetical protein